MNRIRSSRSLLVSWSILILVFVSVPWASAQQKGLEFARAAYPSPNIQYLAAYVADQKGFYKAEGLEMELISMRGAKEAVQALIGGQIQFIMTIGPQMPAIWEGIDIKLVAQQVGLPTFSLMVRKDITKVEELKGKKLGVSFGGSTYSGLKLVLEKFKLNPEKDVEYVNIPGSGPKVAAMQQGLIVGSLLAPPADYMALKAGFKRLLYLGDVEKDAINQPFAVHPHKVPASGSFPNPATRFHGKLDSAVPRAWPVTRQSRVFSRL